ncbi:MAG: PilZ domain-containing protein [Candidatus Omnitrophica bacterium]|nr:PilZ domain-containing protein [Candidatus Omnitrophota bacterium]
MSARLDNRLFERFHARFPVKYKHSRQNFGEDVFLRDASATGVKLTSKTRLFLHDSISLDIQLPDGQSPLTLNGRVVWIKSKSPNLWDVGMEFHKVRFMDTQRMYKFVNTD